jgi:hypothetical protein
MLGRLQNDGKWKMNETYVSTDVEADGPIPGPYSMLSIGSVALAPNGEVLGTFAANLETLPGATTHPDTMAWWKTQPEAWESCRRETQSPEVVMARYAAWVESLPGNPVFVGYPAAFDFLFVYWYLIRFVGRSPFSWSALDMKTYAMAVLKRPFRETVKRNMPARWFSGGDRRRHVALDDAQEQGALFLSMLSENQGANTKRG